LLVKIEPAASSTASETKFSLAIISRPSCWRRVSWSRAAATSGSAWARVKDMRSVIQGFYGISGSEYLWISQMAVHALHLGQKANSILGDLRLDSGGVSFGVAT